MYTDSKPSSSQANRRGYLLKRMGLAGFTFSLLKGLLWQLVPSLAHSAMF